jgi:glycosyltransferase involved in cell wall biosynthesis
MVFDRNIKTFFDEMKKVLHISKYYPPYVGGIEYVCHQVISCLRTKYRHSVICFNDDSKSKIDEYEGIRIVRCGYWKKLAGQALSLSYCKYLLREIRTLQPDIIHFHAPNPLISLYLLALCPKHTKLIVHFHAEILTSKFLYALYRPIEKCLFRRADVIVATSPNMKHEARMLRPYQQKCVVIENAIDTNGLNIITSADENNVERIRQMYDGKKIVFTFGRHIYYKGLRYLIEAEPYIEDCVILIGGDGILTSMLKSMSNSPRIHFIGKIADSEIKYYLHAAWCFAFPSITKAEAFGMTLVQSMYCQVPPITFTIAESGVNYVNLHNITGLEVENGNAHKFAQAINKLLCDETLRNTLAQNAHKRVVEHFTMDIIAAKLADLYKNLTCNKP